MYGCFYSRRDEPESFRFLSVILRLFLVCYNFLAMIGLVKISLDFCDGKRPKISDLFTQYPLFFKYLIGMVLYGLIVFSGTLLLIIPGIIWSLKYWFFDYYIVDQGLGPVKSLKSSSAITKGIKMDLFLFLIITRTYEYRRCSLAFDRIVYNCSCIHGCSCFCLSQINDLISASELRYR